jgi:Fe-S-cluster containining protein
LKDDVKLISTRTGLRTYEFAERCEGSEPYIYEMKKNDKKCVFFKDNACQIYTFRPLICKFYPFQLNNPEEDKFVFNHTDECSGIGKGERLEKEFFEELSAYFIKKMHHK